MFFESMMPFNRLILCYHFLLLPSIFLSIRVFSNLSVLCIRWPKYWSFSFSISPPSEYSGLISFRSDWFDLLADQRTLKSLLQNHNSKASVLQCSAFFAAGHSDGKESVFNAGDLGVIPESGKLPGEGHGNPLQYSCLKNSMDRRPL